MNIKLSDHFSYGKLMKFTVPAVAMMIFTSIYGVVDGFFVSNFAGKTPFAAVNFIMPFLMIVATVGFIFGTGGTAIVAKTFGEGDSDRANRYFSLFTYVSFWLGVLFAVLGIVFIRPIASFLFVYGLCNILFGILHSPQRRSNICDYIIFENTCFPGGFCADFATYMGNRRNMVFNYCCRAYGGGYRRDIPDYKTEKI